jgi:hypothetical protein
MTILWTVVPPEEIFAAAQQTPLYKEVLIDGVLMQVEEVSPAESRVVRIISTRPEDYLNASIQPGAPVTYRPQV